MPVTSVVEYKINSIETSVIWSNLFIIVLIVFNDCSVGIRFDKVAFLSVTIEEVKNRVK